MKKEIFTGNSLAHTKWNCKYHIVFAPKYRRKVFFEEKARDKRYITNAVQMEGGRNNRRRSMSRPHTFTFIYLNFSEFSSV